MPLFIILWRECCISIVPIKIITTSESSDCCFKDFSTFALFWHPENLEQLIRFPDWTIKLSLRPSPFLFAFYIMILGAHFIKYHIRPRWMSHFYCWHCETPLMSIKFKYFRLFKIFLYEVEGWASWWCQNQKPLVIFKLLSSSRNGIKII